MISCGDARDAAFGCGALGETALDALLAEDVDRLSDVAARFDEDLFALHHSLASLGAKLVDHGRGDLSHLFSQLV